MSLKVEQAEPVLGLELADEMQGELRRLAHVVDQSLLIAKAGQGRLTWQSERFDLSAVVSEIVRDFHLLADGEGRSLQLDAEPNCWVVSDAKYCRQVLHGLLTNALTHGRGAIRMRLRKRGSAVWLSMVNEVRQTPAPGALTLGLGLRVVRALLGQQPAIRFRQHAGCRLHATRIGIPLAS
jgi:signal transduction histidine kinase